MIKLSFEEWTAKYISISDEAVEDMKILHNINVMAEVNKAVKYEYNEYLKNFNEDQK